MPSQFFSDMGENLSSEYATAPGVMNHLHLHPQYEVYFCRDAIEQNIIINGKVFRCNSPCVVISPPFFIHSMSSVNESTFPRMVFYFSERVLEKYHLHTLDEQSISTECRMIKLTRSQADKLVSLGELIANEGAGKLDVDEKEMAMVLFLSYLFRLCDESQIETIGRFNLYIQSVFRYISVNFMNNINSESIAKEFSVSRSKLDRDFRSFTGCTLHEFLDLCRLNHAKELLAEKQKRSIEEIATACGFRNESYFYTFFRKHEGLSPLEYRKQFQTS